MPEAAEAPPQSQFAAELEKAFATTPPLAEPGDAPSPEKKEAPVKEPPKKEAPKEPPADAKKTGTPKELFKKTEDKTEEKKEPEPKSAVDEIAPPDFKGDKKAINAWDVLKKEAKTHEAAARAAEARAKEHEAKLAEYEPLKGRLAEHEAKLKEYDEIVSRARLDDHPEFRKEFIEGREKVLGRAKQIIEESGGDPKAIEKALNLTGKARVDALRETTADLDSFQAARLGRAIDELNDLDERAQVKRDAAKKSYDELREKDRQREAETNATRAKSRGLEFDDTVRRLRGELEVLKKVDGYDDWNTRSDTIVKEAKAYVDEHPEADIEAEILSRTTAAYRDMFLQADKLVEERDTKIAELEAELKKIHGKSPSLRPSGGGGGNGATESDRPFMARLKATVEGE